MNIPEPDINPRRMYYVLIAGLIVWGSIHALGATLYGQQPWAGAVVMACFILFLSVWITLLLQRQRRIARRARDDHKESKSGGHTG